MTKEKSVKTSGGSYVYVVRCSQRAWRGGGGR